MKLFATLCLLVGGVDSQLYSYQSSVSALLDIGLQIEKVNAALGSSANYTNATLEYESTVGSGLSLRYILNCGQPQLPACTTEPFSTHVSHWFSQDYMHSFVGPILSDATAHSWTLDDDARKELIMKSMVLEGVLMAVQARVQASADTCSNTQTSLRFLDEAWALYSGSLSDGPIRLAEKRAPQFLTEAAIHEDHSAGQSRVNVRLLETFKMMQSLVQSGDCSSLSGTNTPASRIISLTRVPVIQGMLREAFESDPGRRNVTGGADGFIEVVEGWAFTRAVLPAIDACNASVAQTLERNLGNIGLGPAGAHVPDGFDVVLEAVESTYSCLGIRCDDVNAMADPWRTGQTLWEPCTDPTTTTTTQVMETSGSALLLPMLSVPLLALLQA
ncbi:unnamed protein product [Symbiodinium natans]|uniref:Uncharacterized protein n=1 Tax=Symbiodinium natans TaxID=878477 RepID=A0A812PD10_9DINO|nr:unnamed protein product [Symbiodinium natans]